MPLAVLSPKRISPVDQGAIASDAPNRRHAFLCSVSTKNTRSRLYVTDITSGEGFLVDTGTDVSLLPFRFRGPQLRTHKAELLAVNSSPLSCIGSMDCDVRLSPACSLRGTFYIADVPEPIVGIDFIRKHGLSINMATNTVSHDAYGATFVCSAVTKTSTSPNLLTHLADICVSLPRVIETTSADLLAKAEQRRNLQQRNDELRDQLFDKTAELASLHHRIDTLQLRRSTETAKVSAVVPKVVNSAKVPSTPSVIRPTSVPFTSVLPAISHNAIHPTSDLSTHSPSSDSSFKHFPPLATATPPAARQGSPPLSISRGLKSCLSRPHPDGSAATSRATKRRKRHVIFKLAPDVCLIPAREPSHKSQNHKHSSTKRDGKSKPAQVSSKRFSHKSDCHNNSSLKRDGTSKPAQVASEQPASKQPAQTAETGPCATNSGQPATPTKQASRPTAQLQLAANANKTLSTDLCHAPCSAVTSCVANQTATHADASAPLAPGSSAPSVTYRTVPNPDSTDVSRSALNPLAQPYAPIQPRIATLMDHASLLDWRRWAYETILINTLDSDSDTDCD